jgi:hypothetical protein
MHPSDDLTPHFGPFTQIMRAASAEVRRSIYLKPDEGRVPYFALVQYQRQQLAVLVRDRCAVPSIIVLFDSSSCLRLCDSKRRKGAPQQVPVARNRPRARDVPALPGRVRARTVADNHPRVALRRNRPQKGEMLS